MSVHSTAVGDVSWVLVELGAAIVGLAILARLANRWGFSAIPLYLLAGLAFGRGGLLPLPLSQGFVAVGADIGVILLLFMLGLEYAGAELVANVRRGLAAGLLDFARRPDSERRVFYRDCRLGGQCGPGATTGAVVGCLRAVFGRARAGGGASH